MKTKPAVSRPSVEWCTVDLSDLPHIAAMPPGPQSREIHNRTSRYMKGFSGQVKLFPVAFESGQGCTLTDADESPHRYVDGHGRQSDGYHRGIHCRNGKGTDIDIKVTYFMLKRFG